jgi:hypothetical protein
MFRDPQGPIERFEWGRFVINGETHSLNGDGVGKDICILHGEVRAWKERKGHQLTPFMVRCVLGQGISTLVIGNGVNGALKVKKKTRKAIKEAGIEDLIIERTPQACEIYNRLIREGKSAALLAHGTC